MTMRRRYARLAAAATAAAGLALVVGVPVGSADAHGNAGCVGFEASSISPPGSSEEVPGGMPELIAFVKSEAGNAGPVVSFVAKLHEGSHEACDEATEG
jgi:hypothetical protein